MKTIHAISMALLLLAGCGGGDKATITLDVPDTQSVTETVDGKQDICTPQCEGKECGDDGCGGVCGECEMMLETCSEAGLCEAFECVSTLDCPGDLLCNDDTGTCVVCIGDEDCPEGQTCGADFECHNTYTCTSDKDCKDFGMLCDKEAGICVECFETSDCQPEQYCTENYCIDDVCTGGEARCDGLDVVTCNDEGSAEEVTKTCTETQFCEDGACHDQACSPDSLFCEDNLLQTCGPLGKEIIDTVDCGAEEKVCYQGECVEQQCEPDTTWCEDDFTAAACSEDGASSVTAPCGADQYCEDGTCKAQVCVPEAVYCDGEVYKVCDDKGASVQYEEDCGEKQQHCFNGACIDTVCLPNGQFCKDDFTKATCAEDGMSSTPEACPAEHYCAEGDATVQCFPWVCTPSEAFCEDNGAKVCNSKGSDVINEVGCGAQTCVDGKCVDQVCTPNATYCDGNVVKKCDGDGTSASTVETCGEGQYCGEDGNAAACANQVCTPNEKTCQGTKVMECDDVGAALEEFKDCASEQKGCADGVCVEQVCGNGALDPDEECDDGNQSMCDGCEGCSELNYLYVPDTTDSYVEIIDTADKPLALVDTPFTVEAWVRLDGASELIKVFHRGNGNKGWAFGVEGGLIAVATFNTMNHWPAAALAGTGWRHVAWTFDAGVSRIWLDGALLDEKNSGSAVVATATSTIIGAATDDNGYIKNWHHGRMDELRVSSIVRYVDTFVPARRHVPDSDTIGLWHFDEGEGDSVLDSSSNGHVGNAYQVQWEPDDCYGTSPDAAVCGDGQQAPWEECDDGNTKDGDGCSGVCEEELWYAAFTGNWSWTEASSDCQQRGGHLASIHSPAQNAAVYDMCQLTSGGVGGDLGCWIGLSSPYQQWTDGTAAIFTNWSPGNPDSNGTCVWLYTYSKNGVVSKWDDYTCTHKASYVCVLPVGADMGEAVGTVLAP